MKKRLLLIVILIFLVLSLGSRLTAFAQEESFSITIKENYIKIILLDNLIIKIDKKGEEIIGIADIQLAPDIIFRNSSTPISLLFGIKNKYGKYQILSFREWRFKGYRQEKNRLTLQTSLDINGCKALLDIVFIPKNLKIGDSVYKGLGYYYNLRAKNTKIHMIAEKASWELGGDITKNQIFRPSEYIGRPQEDKFFTNQWFDFTRQEDFQPTLARFGDTQCFDYQTSEQGALVTYYESPYIDYKGKHEPVLIRTHVYKLPKTDSPHDYKRLHIDDYLYFGLTNEIATPVKYVLFNKKNNPDELVALKDYLYTHYRSLYGLKEITHLPTCCISLIKDNGAYLTLKDIVESDILEKISAAGFKRIYMAAETWMNKQDEGMNSYSVEKLEINPKFGSDQDYKKFCRKAHRLGLEIIQWIPSGHLSTESSLVKKSGFNRVINIDSSPCQKGYPDIVSISFKDKKYISYLKERFDHFKKLGLDGVMLDSYSNLGYGVIDYSANNPEWQPQTEELLSLQEWLQKKGFIQLVEWLSPFGLSAMQFESSNFTQWAGRYAECFYKFGAFVTPSVPLAVPSQDSQNIQWPFENSVINTHFMKDYFVFMSNKSPLGFYPLEITDRKKIAGLLAILIYDIVERESLNAMLKTKETLMKNRIAQVRQGTVKNEKEINTAVDILKPLDSFFKPLDIRIDETQKRNIGQLEIALNNALSESLRTLAGILADQIHKEADTRDPAIISGFEKKFYEELETVRKRITPAREQMIDVLVNPEINPKTTDLLIAALEKEGLIATVDKKIELTNKVKSLNVSYKTVTDLMETRHSLKDNRGIIWTNKNNSDKVLFIYENIPFRDIKDYIDNFDKRRIAKLEEGKRLTLTNEDLMREGLVAQNIYILY